MMYILTVVMSEMLPSQLARELSCSPAGISNGVSKIVPTGITVSLSRGVFAGCVAPLLS